ncbi:benzoate 4-monooxygenase cytochrome P450 [Lophiotrema nucula]|uniref:Benzoate 4-monooxygenase cytochrome P450 n=1 Tax=Lophiotrema nucula TaxID=690887 RepID=A0A6A5ZLZ9_9PLEO|nr:benzoate 4-monooxygenase cytochrome P450 [Lophiotrema nucula]
MDNATFGSHAFSIKGSILYAIAASILYWIAIGIYRVYLHPLSKFPGPKLAALTFWYEFYHEIYPHRLRYMWKIEELHKQYGPIVRINPIHLHIHDHAYFEKIYASGSHKRDRCRWFMHAGGKTMAGKYSSMLETMDHDLHKARRNAAAPFFSKRRVHAITPLIEDKVRRLLARLEDTDGRIVDLNNVFAALGMDVVTEYCFAECTNSLDSTEYGKTWLDIFHNATPIRSLGRQFPTLINTILDLPPRFVEKLHPSAAGMASMNTFNENMKATIEKIMRYEDDGKRQTVFHEIREAEKLSDKDKEPWRVSSEASVLLGAGTETTSRTLAVTTFYLLQNEQCRMKLIEELRAAMTRDGGVSLPQLESLPYLSACVNEGLRLAHGISSRQPRIATEADLQYKQWTIPRGTPIMQSIYLLHMDPIVFPDPFSFRPERWIEDKGLTKYLFSFGKGNMSCLGMNLATAELFICVALLFRTMELQIVDTVEERDVLTTRDAFIGQSDPSSQGINARIIRAVSD